MFERLAKLPAAAGSSRPVFRAVAALAILGMALSACATIRSHQAARTERLLAAAGFQMKLADTPDKMARLEALPQMKLVPHTRGDGQLFFLYADAKDCKCLYVGTQEAYQRYQKLEVQQKIVEDQRMTAQMNEDAALDWGMWEPWGPWW